MNVLSNIRQRVMSWFLFWPSMCVCLFFTTLFIADFRNAWHTQLPPGFVLVRLKNGNYAPMIVVENQRILEQRTTWTKRGALSEAWSYYNFWIKPPAAPDIVGFEIITNK